MIRALVLVLVACSSKPAATPRAAPPSPRADGTSGAVCAWAQAGHEPPAPCGAGLKCCAGCGDTKCDAVCTADECVMEQ